MLGIPSGKNMYKLRILLLNMARVYFVDLLKVVIFNRVLYVFRRVSHVRTNEKNLSLATCEVAMKLAHGPWYLWFN